MKTFDLPALTLSDLKGTCALDSIVKAARLHGDSLADLGRQLDLSDDAAKSLLARARRAFRDAFDALRGDAPAPARSPAAHLREVRDAP